MRRKALQPLPPECEELREQLEHWRRTREKRTRVPEAVWATAARLAQEYGTNRISRTLRLNHAALKKRVTNGDVEQGDGPKGSPPAFVELDVCPSPTPTGCIVELQNASGPRLRIELKGAQVHEIAALMRAFCTQDA